MKADVKYAASLLAFILAAVALSWFAVFSFWFSAALFGSVRAVRTCEALASVILIPGRVFFWLMGDVFDAIAPLTSPGHFAAVNGVLLGIAGYASCRRWLFPTRRRAK